uniref:Pentatricopeptide repeat-containing protein At5g43820 n=1 Tax=Elaeis guineensis var. tenera TaxID=51953 RepID=A0A6J0PJH5_ELAGV|nr:putative pentatricopeptide repeat-containing protein At5g43820 [Elaeis guineensis]XP_029120428.1 putative pentatricopeptide repeat-containing protein At5g43820 [Elaeis guineensis]XP_029120429.1 putative pentatricopeptide repeat-containing protein At5g43820 [Elaeis guineensis]XP_029120430.1 putative pentatricopeptide repeat-containing protein At5g43820 [Elaeis guineensis]XP_029120431.1 putative pentatricopeptide repeat-containing protein At5g43820 [Elaeis guineensis]XP_029120432.1 putative p
MAFRTLRFLGFVPPLCRTTYPFFPSFSPRFLSINLLEEASSAFEPSRPMVSERLVLEELSDLLSIDLKTSNPRPFAANPARESPPACVGDRLLSAEEKLRGVFLQKLRGKSAVEFALSSTGVDVTADIFADVLNRGNLGGAAMVLFFNWAVEQPNMSSCVETYNVMLKALGRRKFFEFMEEILVQMKNNAIEPNSETLEIVMDSFVRARQVFKALHLFSRLEEIGAKSDSVSLYILVKCLCRRSHVKVASSFFNRMKGKLPTDNMSYNEIIGGWAKFGRVDKIESYWTMMMAEGLNPDNVTYNHLIEALGRVGRTDDAIHVFEKMEEKGCAPDTMAYNAMISNFISVGDLDKCIQYYKDMSEKNCLPDIHTYNKLISAFLKVRRVADALAMFDEMLNQGILPNTGMITDFIEPLCSFGPPHAAMMIYKKSTKVGCKLSMKAYKLLLMRLSRFGKCGMVLKIWEEMQESGYASDKEVYKFIINGLCNVGQVDNAVLVMEESLQKGLCLGKVVYSKLNRKLLEMNKVETAYKLFLKVKVARVNANTQNFWRANGWHF